MIYLRLEFISCFVIGVSYISDLGPAATCAWRFIYFRHSSAREMGSNYWDRGANTHVHFVSSGERLYHLLTRAVTT